MAEERVGDGADAVVEAVGDLECFRVLVEDDRGIPQHTADSSSEAFSAGYRKLGCFIKEQARILVGALGVLLRLLAEFMGGQMIPFSVGDGGRRVSMRCEIVKLCGSIVGGQRHVALLTVWM